MFGYGRAVLPYLITLLVRHFNAEGSRLHTMSIRPSGGLYINSIGMHSVATLPAYIRTRGRAKIYDNILDR